MFVIPGGSCLSLCHFHAPALGTVYAVPVKCSGRRPTLLQAPAWPDPAFRQVPGTGPRPGKRVGAAQLLGNGLVPGSVSQGLYLYFISQCLPLCFFVHFSLCLFLKMFYLFIHERHTERGRHRQREKQAPCKKPDVGLDPRALES